MARRRKPAATDAARPLPFRVEHTGPNVVTVRLEVGSTAGWSQDFLLRSDAHHDNAHSRRDMEKRHLDEALARRAGIIDCGDLFDVMGGKFDKRSDKSALRPEHQHGDYLDALVKTAADFYEPYAYNWIVMGKGNHECHDDATEILTDSGWLRFDELGQSHRIATMNPESGAVEYQHPTAIHSYGDCPEIYVHRSRAADFAVTGDHRMVYRPQRKAEWRFKRLADCGIQCPSSELVVPVAAVSGKPDWPSIRDDELRLAAWLITDGSIYTTEKRGKKYRAPLFYQRESKVGLITAILDSLGWSYKVSTRQRSTTVVCGRVLKACPEPECKVSLTDRGERQRLLSLADRKDRLPPWVCDLSDRQFGVFLASLVDGDGSRHKSSPDTSWMVYGVKSLLDDIQAACVTHGFKASLSVYRENQYRLNVTPHTSLTLANFGSHTKPTPYAGRIWCVTVPNGTTFTRRNGRVLVSGNSAIRSRLETDLTQRLVATLNDRTGARILAGGYTNWVRLHVARGRETTSRLIWWTHGYGGGGQVTADMIQANRQQVYIENADVMISGHTHDAWHREYVRLKLNDAGRVERRPVHYVKLPTYKDEYGSGEGGWATERGHPPRPLGAYWLSLRWAGREGLKLQITRAD